MRLLEYLEKRKTYVIAEIGQAHDGSLGILHSIVDAVAATGVDAVKFQVHIADAESSPQEPFRIHFSPVDRSRHEYWKRMELSFEQWSDLKSRCDDLGVEFLATPFSNSAVDMLEKLDVTRYKLGSGDIANPLLIERLARTGKEVILSTGLGSLEDIDAAVNTFRGRGNEFSVMQCTTRYPTQADDIGLAWIPKFRERYGCPVGLSDHSGTIFSGLGAVAIGASLLEFHVTFDQRMFGPDSLASLTIDQVSELVAGTRFLETALAIRGDKLSSAEDLELRRIFGKSIAVNRDLSSGHVITFEDLEGKKPSDAGIDVSRVEEVIGRKLSRDKRKWDFLSLEDLS